MLDVAPTRPGVEKMPHDLFQPQPRAAHGARLYYLRQILHDHSDEQATMVLRNLKDAMAPGSVSLIDEIVMPNTGGTGWTFIMILLLWQAWPAWSVRWPSGRRW